MVPNERSLLQGIRPDIIIPIPLNHCHITSSFLRHGGHFLHFLGSQFTSFCLYLENELSYRVGIGLILKPFVYRFQIYFSSRNEQFMTIFLQLGTIFHNHHQSTTSWGQGTGGNDQNCSDYHEIWYRVYINHFYRVIHH